MRLLVHVTNAEWLEGCADTEDHEHPPEFEAVVDIDGYEWMDETEVIDAIHEALIAQCDCCVIECDLDIMETIEVDVWFERPEPGELEEEEETET